jgi:hypothetical protein
MGFKTFALKKEILFFLLFTPTDIKNSETAGRVWGRLREGARVWALGVR